MGKTSLIGQNQPIIKPSLDPYLLGTIIIKDRNNREYEENDFLEGSSQVYRICKPLLKYMGNEII